MQKNILDRKTLQRLLNSGAVNLRGVERETGVAYSVLMKIRDGKGDVYYSTVEKLSGYFLAPYSEDAA